MALKRLYKAILWTAALLLLSLLTACQWMTEDDSHCDQPSELNPSKQYLNITISVANGNHPAATRAPQGGEDGDGREAGFERENDISIITLILADKALGDPDATIQFIKTYPVSRVGSPYAAGTDRSNHLEEAQYTTGNQLVDKNELNLTGNTNTYHAIVVANTYINASAGTLLNTALSNMTLNHSSLFNGNAYSPDNCTHFAMSSEQDATITFSSASDVTITTEPNAIYYNVNQPIIIERLAARIDFCTNYVGGNAGYDTMKDGFKYFTGPTGSDESYFILENITPFNLNNESEYLFKRVTAGWTELEGVFTPAPPVYLANESATNYVVDPNTASKVSTTLAYTNPLGSTAPDWTGNAYLRMASSLNSQTSKTKEVSTTIYDNFMVAYAMENTLLPTSPLKTYATGLAITGSFYTSTGEFVVRKTYYGYLRHQGEKATGSYEACEYADINNTATCGSTPMNFGIVRNNIYRVSIEKINVVGARTIKLKIEEEKWRHVDNPVIYI